MPIALRASTSVAYGTRTNTTVTAPSGAVSGSDVITVAIDVGGGPSSITISTPSGWTLAGSVSYTNPADAWIVNLYIFVRVHDGSSSWTFSHSSGDSQAFASAWSGVDTSTPQDVAAATGNGISQATATIASQTIATAGAVRVCARGSWDGNAITPPAGWTERHDTPVLWVGDITAASTGATGTTTVDAGNANSQGRWGTVVVALRPSSGGSSFAAAGQVDAASAASLAVTGRLPTSGSAPAVTAASAGVTARLGVSAAAAASSGAALADAADRKSTRLNSSHRLTSRMPSSA